MPLSLGDRVFWSIATAIFIGIIWVKFIERYISAWWALVIGFIASVLIMRYGGKEISFRKLIARKKR